MYKTSISNPILRGFNPDPNILKVEDTYYIAVSSFEWLPGIRVYASQDLVNWTHETDILTDQVHLQGNPKNCSIWAPQISYHAGRYYCIYTDVKSSSRPFKDCHNYLITASSIKGPWSEPIYLNSSGFDPSLFHDEDGRSWLLNEIWDYRMTTGNKSAGIVMQEYDDKKQCLIGPRYDIFRGTHLAKTEAPHLYQKNGYYYLVTAEGGTGTGHAVTICRSKQITGPYELAPNSPILTAADKPESPLQCSGHGSLVEGAFGKWYMVYLTTRPLQGHAILGRETAIQEVYWTEDDWLALASGGNGPQQETIVYTKEPVIQQITTDFATDFRGPLEKEWNSPRIMPAESWVQTGPKGLCITSGESPQSRFNHHLLALRQKDQSYEVTTRFAFNPTTYNQMAGLMLYLNEAAYLYAFVTYDEEKGKVLRFMRCQGEGAVSSLYVPLSEQETSLKVMDNAGQAQFYYRESGSWQSFGQLEDTLFLSGGFTGNFIGVAVHNLDLKAGSKAYFQEFTYQGKDSKPQVNQGISKSEEMIIIP